MRQLLFAILAVCGTQPCAADFLEAIPEQWTWPPYQASLRGAGDGRAILFPQVLVHAAQYGTGLIDDLTAAREIAGPMAGLIPDAFAATSPDVRDNVPMPRPREVLEVPNVAIAEVCETLAAAAHSHSLPVPFFIRLIWQESRFDPRAISPVGAQGVAQFMPATAAAVGLKNPFDPLAALRSSARLLRELVAQFGNLGLAAAAYNAGPQRIVDWLARRGKLPEETRNYVQRITGHTAERWRVTRPGRLALEIPKRAPCQSFPETVRMVEVPAPVPMPKSRGRTRLMAGSKGPLKLAAATGKKVPAERKKGAANRKAPEEFSASRKRPKTAAKTKPLIRRASIARKQVHRRHASR